MFCIIPIIISKNALSVFLCVLQLKGEFIAFYVNWAKKLQTLWKNEKDVTEFQSRSHTPIGKL